VSFAASGPLCRLEDLLKSKKLSLKPHIISKSMYFARFYP